VKNAGKRDKVKSKKTQVPSPKKLDVFGKRKSWQAQAKSEKKVTTRFMHEIKLRYF
jgi:hypothetical protein